MDKKPANKFFCRNSHQFTFASIFVVSPFEGNIAFFDIYNAVIGDSDPVSVPSEIFNYTGSVFKRRFAVNNPFF